MTYTYDAGPPLTPRQQAVVDLPADARTLVTAGAGAGKTYTLVRRLDRLVAEEDLNAGEILVLTFSRAAVREIGSRLAWHGEAARHVRAQTFDSWALGLLSQVDAAGDWRTKSFEDRINGARQAIEDGLADHLYAEDLRHVVIDEVQDLVGDRRELVESLLDRYDCGFTVVGDAAQSIYGFTVKDVSQRPLEANRFFDWLRNGLGDELTELALDENFRARTDEARAALPYGPRLRELTESHADGGKTLYRNLRDTLHDRMNLGTLDGFVCSALADFGGTTAVLCRTNGQALVVSEILAANGVEHRVQRSARDRAAPAWIGSLFRATDGSVLTRARFEELVPSFPLPAGTVPDQIWRLLQRTGSNRGNDRNLNLGQLRTALATGRLPDELTAQPQARLIVSSFHRAKGLEFDRVVVVDPGALRVVVPPDPADKRRKVRRTLDIDPAEEARLLYVAMTRPRDELLWLDPPDMSNIHPDSNPGVDRWGRFGFKYWVRKGLELTGGDVFSDQPAGMRDFTGDTIELQDYLATKVGAGDEVVVERLHPRAINLRESPPYLIVHDGRPIGVVSDRFRAELCLHLKTSRNYTPQNWPARMTGVRVDAVETVAGSEAAGVQAGLGPYGVWLAPRLTGLSTFEWDTKQNEEDNGGTAH